MTLQCPNRAFTYFLRGDIAVIPPMGGIRVSDFDQFLRFLDSEKPKKRFLAKKKKFA